MKFIKFNNVIFETTGLVIHWYHKEEEPYKGNILLRHKEGDYILDIRNRTLASQKVFKTKKELLKEFNALEKMLFKK